MNAIELICKEVEALPADKTQKVLDFIYFLKAKPDNQQWQDLIKAQQMSLSYVWDNSDDEVWNDV